MHYKPSFSVYDAFAFGCKAVIDNVVLLLLIICVYAGLFIASAVGCVTTLIVAGFSFTAFSNAFKALIEKSASNEQVLNQFFAGSTCIAITLFIFVLICAVVFFGLGLGQMKIALDIYDTNTSTLSRLFSCFRIVPKAFVVTLVMTAAYSIGMLFFIIPGLYLLVRLFFSVFFMVDKNMGIVASLEASYKATIGYGWQLLSLFLVGLVLNMLGGALGMIGLLITLPINLCAQAYAYRTITSTGTPVYEHTTVVQS